MRTRRPSRASRTAVAVASVDLPTPPLPTKRLSLALAAAGDTAAPLRSVSLDSFLEILQRGVGEPALGLALEQPDHRNDEIDGKFVGDVGARALGREQICAVECLQQGTRYQ